MPSAANRARLAHLRLTARVPPGGCLAVVSGARRAAAAPEAGRQAWFREASHSRRPYAVSAHWAAPLLSSGALHLPEVHPQARNSGTEEVLLRRAASHGITLASHADGPAANEAFRDSRGNHNQSRGRPGSGRTDCPQGSDTRTRNGATHPRSGSDDRGRTRKGGNRSAPYWRPAAPDRREPAVPRRCS